MWTVEKLTDVCKEISAKMNDTFDCPITINARLSSTLGRVKYVLVNGSFVQYTGMEFSKRFLETSSDESIISVIQHEWAHYYTTKTTGEKHGHDILFKEVCAKIGCANDKTHTAVERTVAASSVYKYTVYCKNCSKTLAGFQRMCGTLKQIDAGMCRCNYCKSADLYYTQNW